VRRAAAVIFSSEPVAEIAAGDKLYGLGVWSTPAARANINDLVRLPIDTPNGGRVPLASVAAVRVRPTPSEIVRENGSGRIEVDADISGRNLGSVTADVRARLAKLQLPRGYHAALLGEAAERAAAQKHLLTYGIAAAVVIFLLPQAGFHSVRLATLMFLTLPVGLVGGVIAIWAAVGTVTLGALICYSRSSRSPLATGSC
jgi:Cu/Ag efflux pump CusA